MDAIVVYGASSPGLAEEFIADARRIGSLAAANGLATVTGAGRTGMMGAVIEGTLKAGGHTIGVIPQFMIDRGWNNPLLDDLRVTPDMHSRKKLMASLSCGAIALPGGVGTLDELMEIITWRQLGLYSHPVVLLNTLGFFNPLLDMLDHTRRHGMMRPTPDSATELFTVASTPEEAIRTIIDNR